MKALEVRRGVLSDSQASHRQGSRRAEQVKKANRKIVVVTALIGGLTFTSALVLALAPAPLTPGASSSPFALDAPDSMDVIFQTQQASTTPGQWKYIYIHHSRTTGGNAVSMSTGKAGGLGDHFVIGNGSGAVD